MKILTNVALIVVWMAAAGLLFAGLFPGLLSDLLFLAAITFIFWGPLVLAGVISAGSRRVRLERATQMRLLFAGLALLSSALLTALTIPRRLAFAAFRGDFEVLAQSAAATIGPGDPDRTPLNRRVGLWWVSDYDGMPLKI